MVLVVDQFEECWTLAGTAEREHFLSALAHAVSRSIRCVVTVRADLYDRPLRDQLVGQLVADGTFPLPPLSIGEQRFRHRPYPFARMIEIDHANPVQALPRARMAHPPQHFLEVLRLVVPGIAHITQARQGPLPGWRRRRG